MLHAEQRCSENHGPKAIEFLDRDVFDAPRAPDSSIVIGDMQRPELVDRSLDQGDDVTFTRDIRAMKHGGPAAITRSIHLPVSYDQPDTTRAAISEALDSGFRHFTLGLPAQPYPAGVARWVADELVATSV